MLSFRCRRFLNRLHKKWNLTEDIHRTRCIPKRTVRFMKNRGFKRRFEPNPALKIVQGNKACSLMLIIYKQNLNEESFGDCKYYNNRSYVFGPRKVHSGTRAFGTASALGK